MSRDSGWPALSALISYCKDACLRFILAPNLPLVLEVFDQAAESSV